MKQAGSLSDPRSHHRASTAADQDVPPSNRSRQSLQITYLCALALFDAAFDFRDVPLP
jgi:hypothetical protein